MTLPTLHLTNVLTTPLQPPGKTRKLLQHLDNNDYLLEIDWSSIERFTACNRSAEWSLIYSRNGRPHYALVYGAALHEGLELYYRGVLEGNPPTLDSIIAACEHHFTAIPPQQNEWRTFDRLQTTLSKYIKKYSNEDNFTVQRVEDAFSTPLATISINANVPYGKSLLVADCTDDAPDFFVENIHVSWTGVIDLVVESNGIWIMDHKTYSVGGDSFWKGFELSQQMLGYSWAGQQLLNEQIKGATVNGIYGRDEAKSDSAKRSQAEKEFLRRNYFYSQDQISEWRPHMVAIISDFINDLVRGMFPMKSQWCVGKYGVCPYHDVCTMPRDKRLTMLSSDQYVNNVWSPLE